MWLNQAISSWYSYVTSFVITGEVPGMFCTEKFSIRWYAILQQYIIWFWITCTCTGTYYGNFNTVEKTSRYEVYIVHTSTHTAVDSILNFIIYATEKKIFLYGFFYRWEPVTGCRDWCSGPITSHPDFLSLGDPSSCCSLSQESLHSQTERGMFPVHITYWYFDLCLNDKTSCFFFFLLLFKKMGTCKHLADNTYFGGFFLVINRNNNLIWYWLPCNVFISN